MSTDIDPVDSTVLDRLEQCSTSAIADTKHESVETLNSAIKPVYRDCTFAGTVRTVVLDPQRSGSRPDLDTALRDEVFNAAICVSSSIYEARSVSS